MFCTGLGNIREIAQFGRSKAGWCNCPFLSSIYMIDLIITGYTSPPLPPPSKKKGKVTPFSIKINNLEQDIIVLIDLQSRSQVHYSALPMCMLTVMPTQDGEWETSLCPAGLRRVHFLSCSC